jgi:hypothetical protein
MVNAFAAMMKSSQMMSSAVLPERTVPPQGKELNGKEQLGNTLVSFFEEHKLTLRPEETKKYGFYERALDILWYLDGQADKFKNRSAPLSVHLQPYQGIDLPTLQYVHVHMISFAS